MDKVRIHLVSGARPNFMKISPLYHCMKCENWIEPLIVHTGQHYDHNMSLAFFKDFNLPEPDINLEVGSGTHAEQTSAVMVAYEKLLLKDKPDWVIVVGDVNSTMACTIAAKKLNVKVAHLEAGLRSFDRTMPEEINRVVTDALADILWTPSPDADRNLLKEGIDLSKIERVGNIMIDTLLMMMSKVESDTKCNELGLENGNFGVVTLHRPSNVDDCDNLSKLCDVLLRISKNLLLVFPLHPRTKKYLMEFNLYIHLAEAENIILIEPMGYVSFMNLIINSKLVITDSGGIQEETTFLGIPCFTLRPNTERPITLEMGTNRLTSLKKIESDILDTDFNQINSKVPPLWDGKSAFRIIQSLRSKVVETR